MNIDVINGQRKYRVDEKKIRKYAARILSLCNRDNAGLVILIVNNRAMRRLNRQFRGIDKPTDVLSFPFVPFSDVGRGSRVGGVESHRFLGDLVISMEKVHEQSEERGHTPGKEFRILLIHGILHLLGYDHEISRSEAQKMKRKEIKILSGL